MRYLLPIVLAATFAVGPAIAATADTSAVQKAIDSGKLQEANTIYLEMLQKTPQRADIHLAYAKFLRSMGQTELAIQEFQRSLQLNANQPDAYVALSQISLQTLDVDSATKYALSAMKLAPGARDARLVYVNALVQGQHTAQADSELAPLMAMSPKDADVLHLAYQIKARKGDFQTARGYLEQAVQIQPDKTEWMIELCKLLESSGDYESARHILETALQRNHDSADARLHLARNLEVYANDYDGAASEYAKVLQVDPNSAAALTGIDRCRAKKNDLALRMKLGLQSIFGRKQ